VVQGLHDAGQAGCTDLTEVSGRDSDRLALPGRERSLTWCTGGSRAECSPFLSFFPFSSAPSSAS